MFTGIVRHIGTVRSVGDVAGRRRLCVDCGPIAREFNHGDSVCVDGVCLTAAAIAAPTVEFDVGGETLAHTTLSDLKPGDSVNIEPALSASGRFDGHIVQGHVDGVGRVADIRRSQPWTVTVAVTRELAGWMVPRGSVAVNGVSLTLTQVAEDSFSVALIPTTLEETTLEELNVGDKVNVETDILGKYVRRYLEGLSEPTGGLTLDKLKDNGFV